MKRFIYMHVCIYFMTRVISISDSAYEELVSLKENNESFSKVVLKLASKEKKKSILEFAGKWNGSNEELDSIFKKILKERHSYKGRDIKF